MKVGDLRVGASGSVQLAVDLRFGTKVAIKFIDRGSSRYGLPPSTLLPLHSSTAFQDQLTKHRMSV